MDQIVADARHHLDAYGVLCYPFEWFVKGREDGIREETVGNRPTFLEWWDRVETAARDHHEPGSFVAFPGYEWNGDRTRWGDHNVFYFEAGHPLEDAETAEDLYEHATDHDALAIPHHTGYAVGNRAKDWDVFDPDRSPVTEVFSGHGSSEGIDTPFDLASNGSMSPRTSGGTYVDALNRGLRVGAIASNDGWGVPGTWGNGVAGLWSTELTREGVREALEARRTYGVTGDRMDLWWSVNGHSMGDLGRDGDDAPSATAHVRGKRRLDRLEVVHDGRVVRTYAHQDEVTETPEPPGRYTTVVDVGWGPSGGYGDFDRTQLAWTGTISIEGGVIDAVQPRFRGSGQRVERVEDGWHFDVTTDRSGGAVSSPVEGLVLEFQAEADATLVVDFEDAPHRETIRIPVADLLEETHLVAFDEEVVATLEEEFALTPADVENTDTYYHNTPKCRIHSIHHLTECAASVAFDDLPRRESGKGRAYYYLRASQVDGQYAWSSPVWLESA
jgi:hypothetical protein